MPLPPMPELYVQVQNFYARQMHLLDEGRLSEFGRTFTSDGTHQPSPGKPPARGAEEIIEAIRKFDERFADDPKVRRHWFGCLASRQPAPRRFGHITTLW